MVYNIDIPIFFFSLVSCRAAMSGTDVVGLVRGYDILKVVNLMLATLC